jgi:hypothetical protein
MRRLGIWVFVAVICGSLLFAVSTEAGVIRVGVGVL